MTHVLNIFRIKQQGASARLELPDYLRGMAMLLVLLHHAGVPYGEWILAFHMPFLFALSGYMEAILPRKRTFLPYLMNRCLRLLVPYFLFEGINLAVWSASLILQGGWQDLSEAAKAILICQNTMEYTGYYGRLWFLPCMFVSDMLFFFIKKLSGGRKAVLWISAAAMLGLSWCTCYLLPGRLPFTVDTACMATAFLIFGYALGEKISWLLNKKHLLADILILGVMLMVMRVSVLYGRGYCLMFINNYGPFVWSVLAAFSGSAAFLVIAKWLYPLIKKMRSGMDLVLWYGCNSLATFPVHLSVKMWTFNSLDGYLWPWYALLAVIFLLNIPIVNFITQYLPFMLGKFPVRKKKTVI